MLRKILFMFFGTKTTRKTSFSISGVAGDGMIGGKVDVAVDLNCVTSSRESENFSIKSISDSAH
jgi:hypothetical protein